MSVARQGSVRTSESITKRISIALAGLAAFSIITITTRWPMAWVALAVAVLGLAINIRTLRFPAPFWWGAALVGWAFATSSAALSPELARATAFEQLKVMIVFWVALNVLRTYWFIRVYLIVIVAAFMFYPARGSLLFYVHGYTLFGRAIWNNAYQNPNDLGAVALLVTGAALSLAAWPAEAKTVRWGSGISVGVLVIVMLLTQSRGVFLGLVIGFGPPLMSRFLKRPKLAIYALVCAAITIAALPDSLWTRLGGISKLTSTATIAQADPEGSAAQRWEIAQVAWRIFKDHPLVGVGLGCYAIGNAIYAPQMGERDTHNTYLNLAAETGFPGLLLWLGLVWSVFAQVRSSRRSGQRQPGAFDTMWLERALIGFLVAGIFGSYAKVTSLYLMLATVWCAAKVSGHSWAPKSAVRKDSRREY